ncbi:protein atonal homolog 8 [Eurytemora carolleeae]|uniref:protein atonal homolog 8 n=1 Tax=Eurytemora carolleeae TaxID=1294199 RepID=UPI000C78769C|nr:protein atonal homolog 8 [Eurytemora carolleeae]|eukprot:XP_023332923.1 protein atonal homolog 8-like [Eurytemora affinis]
MTEPGVRRNKRKSLEPKKLQTFLESSEKETIFSLQPSSEIKLILKPFSELKSNLKPSEIELKPNFKPLEGVKWSKVQTFEPWRSRLNSTGSEERSPPLIEPGPELETEPEPEPEKRFRIPSPLQKFRDYSSTQMIVPKKRFKIDSLINHVSEREPRLLPCMFPGPVDPIQPVQEEPLDLIIPKTSKKPIYDIKSTEVSKRTKLTKDILQQKNYKNSTRIRRIEANARERQRVHTITAAFDTLQAAIPSEDENIKLSKLSVIKIATAYIMALSRMAGYDYTEDRSAPSLESVLEHCRETIHTESRIKKRL